MKDNAKLPTKLLLVLLVAIVASLAAPGSHAQVVQDAPAKKIKKNDTFFQYSNWRAFVNRVFDGDLTVKQMVERGDIGLGSYDFLDGEMIMVDSVPYRIREDGEVTVAKDDDQLVYVNATHFEADVSQTFKSVGNYEEFRGRLNSQLGSKNYFYAFRVNATFSNIKLGGLNKQKKPFDKGLDVLIPNRPVFESEKVKGTMIGFFCPDFIGDINVAGYHFHFISDDRKLGGHVMEFESATDISVEIDRMRSYQFLLPATEEYSKVDPKKEFQYRKN